MEENEQKGDGEKEGDGKGWGFILPHSLGVSCLLLLLILRAFYSVSIMTFVTSYYSFVLVLRCNGVQ